MLFIIQVKSITWGEYLDKICGLWSAEEASTSWYFDIISNWEKTSRDDPGSRPLSSSWPESEHTSRALCECQDLMRCHCIIDLLHHWPVYLYNVIVVIVVMSKYMLWLS